MVLLSPNHSFVHSPYQQLHDPTNGCRDLQGSDAREGIDIQRRSFSASSIFLSQSSVSSGETSAAESMRRAPVANLHLPSIEHMTNATPQRQSEPSRAVPLQVIKDCSRFGMWVGGTILAGSYCLVSAATVVAGVLDEKTTWNDFFRGVAVTSTVGAGFGAVLGAMAGVCKETWQHRRGRCESYEML